MEQERKNRLTAAGIDVDAALERVMGSEALLERLLGKFVDDGSYEALCRAMDAEDQASAAAAAHTLKGICANLSMTELYACSAALVNALRAADRDTAQRRMAELTPLYRAVCRAIREA